MSQLINQLAFFFAEKENKHYFAVSKPFRTMRRNRIGATLALVFIIAAGIILTGGCKKQPKCGCDGDALDTLKSTHVYISYDEVNKTARFSPIWDSYSIYYFCNPSEWISQLTKFAQGEEILVSGPYFYECNYLMNSSNSYYYSYMRIYQVQVTNVAAYDYGK
jgi:hypothetical protein